MNVGLRHFGEDTIRWLRTAVEDPDRSLTSIARELCEREDWRNPKGEYRVTQGSVAIRRLAKKLGLSLPTRTNTPKLVLLPAEETHYPDLDVKCEFGELGPVSLELVAKRERRLWRAMIQRWHPQGWTRIPGAQVLYWIRSPRYGRLGGIGFVAASWRQKARDNYLGWSDAARVGNIDRVVNNHRFLLLPGVRVKNLASHVLASATRRLPADWEEEYGVRPMVAYTYVDGERKGTCYRAAGWDRCPGRTSGRPPTRHPTRPKSVWMRPLAPGWRTELGKAPRRRIGSTPPMYAGEDANWADLEYGRGAHFDGRVRKRIVAIGRAWAENSGPALRGMFPKRAARTALLRLLLNPRVALEDILAGHQEATVARCRTQPTVLAILGTTVLERDGRAASKGSIDSGPEDSRPADLTVHVGLAVAEDRRPLGVFALDASESADESAKGDARWYRGAMAAAELAAACPDTRIVVISLGAFNVRKTLLAASESGSVVVAPFGREDRLHIAATKGTKDLWRWLARQPVMGTRTMETRVPGAPKPMDRKSAPFDIRAATVDLRPSDNRADAKSLTALAVFASERNRRGDGEPYRRALLCSEGTADLDTALQVLRWFEVRWAIEDYFDVLRARNRIADPWSVRGDARKSLAFDAVTAWRVLDQESAGSEATSPPPARKAIAEPNGNLNQ